MCLIINKPKHVNFGRMQLRDFWRSNRDGAGIMWFADGAVRVEKITSPTVDQWVAFYEQYAKGRACVIHLRMRTHGEINDDNTHPYYVGRGYFLMHNGVLASGNAKDTGRSDTWHFINDALRPALRADARCFEKRAFVKGLGDRIDRNNRFAILGPSGKVIIVNKDAGVVHDGAWFSNTYAWTAPRTASRYAIPTKNRAFEYDHLKWWRDRSLSESNDADYEEAPVRIITPAYLRKNDAQPVSAFVQQLSLLEKGRE